MSAAHPTSLTVQVPLAIRRRPGRKTVVTPDGKASAGMPADAVPTRADPALVKALARAFRYQRLLDDGQYASITEMAEAEKLDRGYVGRLLQLTLLAPNLVEAVLDGHWSEQLDLPSLLKPLPLTWDQQGGVRTQEGRRTPRGRPVRSALRLKRASNGFSGLPGSGRST